jgi:hypothetical protein
MASLAVPTKGLCLSGKSGMKLIFFSRKAIFMPINPVLGTQSFRPSLPVDFKSKHPFESIAYGEVRKDMS